MTKLNPEQTQFLADIATLKGDLTVELEGLKADYDRAVDEAKRHVRKAVGNAVYAGVPDRRIGMALGTSDHKTIKSYYPEVVGLASTD